MWEEIETIVRGDRYKVVLERCYRPVFRWHSWSVDLREEYDFGSATTDPEQAREDGLAEMERLTYCRPEK